MKSSQLIWAGIPLFLVSVALIVWWLPAWWHYYHDLNWMDRAIFNMDRRGNLPFHFYGLVVDQDDKPLCNVKIEITISAFNENWAYEPHSERVIRTHVVVVSNAAGRFQFETKGIYMQIQSVTLAGYQWLYDLNNDQTVLRPQGNNTFFSFASDGEPWPYQSRRDSPAIFVLVKNGVKDVRAMPSRGGVDFDPGHQRMMVNHPIWPLKPSLPKVHYISPSSRPTTTQSWIHLDVADWQKTFPHRKVYLK